MGERGNPEASGKVPEQGEKANGQNMASRLDLVMRREVGGKEALGDEQERGGQVGKTEERTLTCRVTVGLQGVGKLREGSQQAGKSLG